MDIETLYEVRVQGHAGMVLDAQQDSGAVFDKIAQWWPGEFGQPQLGVRQERGTFAALVKVGELEVPVWPLTTPEDALLSQMYFTMVAPIVLARDTESLGKIASLIKEACHIHGVDVPEGFGQFCKAAALDLVTHEELMAAPGLPVTTRQQAAASCDLFERNTDRWSVSDQVVIATKLTKSAQAHGLDWSHPYAITGDRVKIASSASRYLERRRDILSTSGAIELAGHQRELDLIKEAAGQDVTPSDFLKIAERLERVDRLTGLNQLYGEHLPNVVSTLVEEFSPDPLGQLERTLTDLSAPEERDWTQLNLDKLASSGLCPDAMLEMLRRNPTATMSQLDASLQEVFAEYLEG